MKTNAIAKQYQLNEWAQAIKAQKASGLTIENWCHENNVTKAAFYYRLRKVRQTYLENLEEQTPQNLVPISTLIASNESETINELSIHCNECELRINGNTSMPLLESVLKVVRNV